MLAMLSLPYTGYAHAILCWCFILAYSDSNMPDCKSGETSRLGERWGNLFGAVIILFIMLQECAGLRWLRHPSAVRRPSFWHL